MRNERHWKKMKTCWGKINVHKNCLLQSNTKRVKSILLIQWNIWRQKMAKTRFNNVIIFASMIEKCNIIESSFIWRYRNQVSKTYANMIFKWKFLTVYLVVTFWHFRCHYARNVWLRELLKLFRRLIIVQHYKTFRLLLDTFILLPYS